MTKPLVLLVDDAPEMGAIVAMLGKRTGYETACRPDVPSAQDYLRVERPDLILLDVHLPGQDGLELCRDVRATPALADLPIALFGHWGLPGDIIAGLEAGIDYLVCKDLVSRPEAWRHRLGEILPAVRGQPCKPSLGWRVEESPPLLPSNWIAVFNRSLGQSCWRRLDAAVLREVLQRALRHAFPGADTHDWLRADDCSLHGERLPPAPPGAAAISFIAYLAKQIWCLLGTEASKPYWRVLATVVPGQPEPR